jgi:hypothetical protein
MQLVKLKLEKKMNIVWKYNFGTTQILPHRNDDVEVYNK